jgi:hypothetical protein
LVEQEEYVRQATITLRYGVYEVPVLSLGNGTRSMLAIALCECWDYACSLECGLITTQ